jgi:hypothetical protein
MCICEAVFAQEKNGGRRFVVSARRKSQSLFQNTDREFHELPQVSPAVAEPLRTPEPATRTISDLIIENAFIAVRESVECETIKDLRERLVKVLPQNSLETRTRYARFAIRWFFPDGIDGVARRTWVAYQDEKLLSDVVRYLYLSQEPVMGKCVADCLFPIEPGMRVPGSVFDRFLSAYYSGPATKKTTQRLKSNLMKLGILERASSDEDQLNAVAPAKTSLILLTHYVFARTEVRTVELKRVWADPFWKYLGFKSEDAVRAVFREADAAGIFGKYVVADQLEQITTRWSFDDFLSNKPRL